MRSSPDDQKSLSHGHTEKSLATVTVIIPARSESLQSGAFICVSDPSSSAVIIFTHQVAHSHPGNPLSFAFHVLPKEPCESVRLSGKKAYANNHRTDYLLGATSTNNSSGASPGWLNGHQASESCSSVDTLGLARTQEREVSAYSVVGNAMSTPTPSPRPDAVAAAPCTIDPALLTVDAPPTSRIPRKTLKRFSHKVRTGCITCKYESHHLAPLP